MPQTVMGVIAPSKGADVALVDIEDPFATVERDGVLRSVVVP